MNMIFLIILSSDEVELLRSRNPDVFAKLYKEYKLKVYNFLVIKTSGDKDIADEVFSDTFHSALKSAPKIKNAENIQSWLLQIAKRRLMDYFRKKYREEKYLQKVHEPNEIHNEIEEKINKDEKILMVKMALKNMKPLYAQILQLKYIENKSQKEIAAVVNKSRSSVESLLFRAREQLKKEMKKLVKEF